MKIRNIIFARKIARETAQFIRALKFEGLKLFAFKVIRANFSH